MHTNVAIVLRLGGIREVLYGADGTYTPGGFYTSINCIDLDRISSLREEMPKFGGVAKPSGLTLHLIDRNEALSELFSATMQGVKQTRIAVSLVAETGTALVETIDDVSVDSAWPDSGQLYIGQETISYASKDPSAFVVSTRGGFDSVISDHLVDNSPSRSWNPVVTKYPVHWKGRKAILSVHEVRQNGTVDPDGIELIRGILNGSPVPDDDGSWSVTIVQETAKFDQELGDTRFSSTLVEGHHYFDGETAKKVYLGEYLNTGGIVDFGLCDLTFDDAAGTGEWTTPEMFIALHLAVFGTNRGNYVADPANGLLDLWSIDNGYFYGVIPSGYAGGLVQFTFSDPGEFALPEVNQNGTVQNSFQEIPRALVIASAEGLQRWPSDAIAEFNDKVNVTQTANGEYSYIDCSLSADGAELLIQCGFAYDLLRPPMLSIYRFNPASLQELHFPWLHVSEDTLDERGNWTSVDAGNGRAQIKTRIGARNIDKEEFNNAIVPLRPASLGFYQAGEKFLLIRDNLFTGATEGAVAIRDTNGNEQMLQFEDVIQTLDSAGAVVGYRLQITEQSRNDPAVWSFENTPASKITIVPHIEFRNEDPRLVLLRIMLSGFGSIPGFPHAAYSVLPPNFGLRIEPDSVDAESFRSFPLSNPLRGLSFRPIRPISARELIDPILQAMGAAIVPANVGGTRKLKLVKARTTAFAVDSVANGDWIASARPLPSSLDDVVNVFHIFGNYDAREDKFNAQANFEDQTSIDAYGQAQSLDLKIRGLNLVPEGIAAAGIEAHSAFITLYKNIRATAAFAVPVFAGSLKWSVAQGFTVGRTVSVTIAEARDGNRVKGTIVNKAMLIRAIDFDPINRRVYVELFFRGWNTTSFAPAARVIEVIDVDTVRLSENIHSNLANPYTGAAQKDWTFFLSSGVIPPGGTDVRKVRIGEEENNANGVITALNTGNGHATIAAHGLAVGDRIRPRSWDLAESFHKIYAFLSDGGTLGAADDPGFVYS